MCRWWEKCSSSGVLLTWHRNLSYFSNIFAVLCSEKSTVAIVRVLWKRKRQPTTWKTANQRVDVIWNYVKRFSHNFNKTRKSISPRTRMRNFDVFLFALCGTKKKLFVITTDRLIIYLYNCQTTATISICHFLCAELVSCADSVSWHSINLLRRPTKTKIEILPMKIVRDSLQSSAQRAEVMKNENLMQLMGKMKWN